MNSALSKITEERLRLRLRKVEDETKAGIEAEFKVEVLYSRSPRTMLLGLAMRFPLPYSLFPSPYSLLREKTA
ncbi:MAG: hypothetical protein A2Y62_10275 [Candidatus Fischerbacteria bacterium RBG_13_37_8]|uniref:Uncharacterized protein n=1 Tax=Candidatus Fischerbacteria bacterium RBG_13_37_8 TaxID=1817863 RepID=A0A1F5VYB1_9BACT|nr:MAG: hypothetical protein A2Y62_10275 [Candidatus Fischerbacteria bacterium RBG_13_37_8]